MHRLIVALMAALGLLGTTGAVTASAAAPSTAVVVVAAPVAAAPVVALPAGNGTSNFYGKGHCGLNMGGGEWIDLKFTTWDSGSNQTVHTNITRSGRYIEFKIYINQVYRDKNDVEDYYTVGGWGRVNVTITAWMSGKPKTYSCGDDDF